MRIKHPRVLGVVRLSVDKDESTSPERQREHIEHWANGPAVMGTVVGWAEDLDVSGSVSPFKRPGLGSWLNRRADDFDVICVWKLDRLTRRSRHFAELLDWCNERGKSMVSTSESLDLSTPMGKMFAQIIAAFAEGELDTIQARSLDASRKLREKGAWFGGVLPFGYRFADREDGGKCLVQDPVYAPLLRAARERVMSGAPVNRLTKEFNGQGLPTWRDHLRTEAGKSPRGTLWTSKAIEQALKNPRSAGFLLHKGEIVEGEDGEPVFIADEPIFSMSEWEEVARKLSATRKPRTRTPTEPSLLTGVARCGIDGGSLYVKRNTVKRSYKEAPDIYATYTCRHAYSGAAKECRTAADEKALDLLVECALLFCFGSKEVYEKRATSRSELEAELGRVTARLARLEDDYVGGKYDEEGQEESYYRMHAKLATKQAALKPQIDALPTAEYIGTGQTFYEIWECKGIDERRSYLIEHEVRALVWRSNKGLKEPHVKIEMPNVPGMHDSMGVRGGAPWEIMVLDVNMPEHLQEISIAGALGHDLVADAPRHYVATSSAELLDLLRSA